MPNMRIISRNVVKRAVLVASTTAGTLAVSNLQSNDKSKVFRAQGNSVTITGTLPVAEYFSCMHLPFCDLSPTATWTIRFYSGTSGVGLVRTVASALACAAPARVLEDWTAAQSARAYANGGGTHAESWFPLTLARTFVIDIVDTNNLNGAIEAAAALVGGEYYSPDVNPTAMPMTPVDSTELYRNKAGGQMADAGNIHRTMAIDLSPMSAAERTKFVGILMNSRASPILVCGFPESGDPSLSRDYNIYGRRPDNSEVSIQYSVAYGSKIAVEEI